MKRRASGRLPPPSMPANFKPHAVILHEAALAHYFYVPLTKTRLKSGFSKSRRESDVPSIHCDVPWRACGNVLNACRTSHFCAVRRLDRQRHAHEKSGHNNQSHIFKPRRAASTRTTTTMPPKEIGRYISTPQALHVEICDGLAERGQRRVEEPPFGLDQFGLDSYVDPELF